MVRQLKGCRKGLRGGGWRKVEKDGGRRKGGGQEEGERERERKGKGRNNKGDWNRAGECRKKRKLDCPFLMILWYRLWLYENLLSSF